MCGIVGILGPEGAATAERRVEQMVQALHHRGPDGDGVQTIRVGGVQRQLVLGHARLAILDLSDHATQPMTHAETGSVLVYNGEIYNFRAVRRELESLGHTIRSSGDTEVVLRALVQWGEEGLRKLRGMYALAFWDGRQRRLVLARDPFGIKPLLYTHVGDAFAFASELRALTAAGGVEAEPDPEALREYLQFGNIPEPRCAIRGVTSVPPGHVVIVDDAGRVSDPRAMCTLEQEIDGVERTRHISHADAVAKVRGELERSVREQLVSDVPLGIFLSGGIDSSLVAGLAGDGGGTGDQLTYLTVGFPEREFSEVDVARGLAAQLPGHHRVVDLSGGQLRAMLPAALAAMDQPTVDGINTFVVSRVAREQGIKVVLSGLGGDELFAGYTTFWKAPVLGRFSGALSRVARFMPGRLVNPSERAKLQAAPAKLGLRRAYLLQRSIRDGLILDEGELHGDSDYQRVSYLESTIYMRNQLLRDSDIFSSANSIELRVPFLDLDVARLAWSLPPRLMRGKRLLKDIHHQLFPSAPSHKRKMGFALPWNVWMRDRQFAAMLSDVIQSDSLYAGLPITAAEGKRTFAEFTAQTPTVTWAHVWSLFVLLGWVERTRSQRAAA